MFLIVGLGNPGKNYENTPHNAGFMFMDKLYDCLGYSNTYSVDDWKMDSAFEAELSFGRLGQEIKFILAKPTTFMNLSGKSVSKLVKKFNVNVKRDFVLAHDDLDIRLGEFKVQRIKSPKEHNGILSVENFLSEVDFWRVRLGVDNRSGDYRMKGEEYVLKKYSENELFMLSSAIDDAIKILRSNISL